MSGHEQLWRPTESSAGRHHAGFDARTSDRPSDFSHARLHEGMTNNPPWTSLPSYPTHFQRRDGSAASPLHHDDEDDDEETDSEDEGLGSPEMFEYANPGMHFQYTDTDIDLERSLELQELLEHEGCSDDALHCYRNDKFEDGPIITLADVERGMDMQGIRWKQGQVARNSYRRYRLCSYENYFNDNGPFRGHTTPCVLVPPSQSFMSFVQMQTQYKCSLVHFQLRNLMTAIDRHSLYYTDVNKVNLYSPQEHSCRQIMDLSDRSILYPFKISSLALTDRYCCVGGHFGEFAMRSLEGESDDVHVGTVTRDITGITNHICPRISRSGTHEMAISSNDCFLRTMDASTLQITNQIPLDHPLNCSVSSTDKRMQLVVGDHCSAFLLDADTGEQLSKIDGHTDFSFACAWSSDGHTFATGSQDLTTRLYDARGSLDTPIAIYKASIGAIRSLKFSECGRFLAIAEPADFVHLYDMKDPGKVQQIDFFGEISGIDFTGDSFFIGNADRMIGGIAEFQMSRDTLGADELLL